MFEDGERRDAIEPLRLGVQFSGKAARFQLETVRLQGLDRGVDPDGVLDAGKRPIDGLFEPIPFPGRTVGARAFLMGGAPMTHMREGEP